jgi:hypothetical protein
MKGLVVRIAAAARVAMLATLTPLLEKNVIKTLSVDVPFIFSMSRVIVLGFALAMLRQIWRMGISGWPEATLSMAIVLALPMFGALAHVKPNEVLELSKLLISRFGIGGTRPWTMDHGPWTKEPSKFDDHREDA